MIVGSTLKLRVTSILAFLGALAMTAAAIAQLPVVATPTKCRVYIGTYTGEKSKGIYLSELDLKSGELTPLKLAAELANPTFMAIHPSGRYLHAIGEISDFNGKKAGAVSALAIDAKTGMLQLLNQQPSGGPGPCHVSIDPTGSFTAAANYGGGSVCVHPIKDDGSLGEMTAFIQHEGKGPTPRQSGPNAHSINFDKSGKLAFAADLGLDKIFTYELDSKTGKLSAHEPAFTKVSPGDGPRHFAFHPSGKFAFVINEMGMTITTFAYDAAKGTLTTLEESSTLPPNAKGDNLSTAEVQVHPSGKFVYGSNRGHDTIAVFTFDEEQGKLKLIQNQGEGVSTPRNFGIDPTGTLLLVGNQSGNSVSVFKINQDSGELIPTEHKIEVNSPVCIKFLPIP